MRIIRIGIDIDGVIVDLVTAMLPLLSKACGRPVCHDDIHCFDIGKALHIEDKMDGIWADVNDSGIFRTAPPIKGAIAGLGGFRKHKIYLVTQRPKSTQSDTEWWLCDKEIKYNKLEFVTSGAKHLVGKNFDVFLEDDFQQACAMAEAGVDTLLLDHPWNRSSWLPRRCRRVQDWNAIIMHIKILERTSPEN